ncbi:flavin reductase family protein [Arthrobacter ramosus]|uniref:Flavin reductase family protein n=1 Tax=Arthrobacter ramosus TaxID=1672 RepID=A0ABV5Y4P8_ARTRM|nr:flavin reductase family protein [Arthrobacter ramosus]
MTAYLADPDFGDLVHPDFGMPTRKDPSEFRTVLGHFVTGLTIVTAMTDDGPVGFTCQSFTSLSLDPPLVVLCVSNTSSTWPRIREAGRFCINVLSARQRALSDKFARSQTDKFSGVSFDLSPNGAPYLPGAVAWIDCDLEVEHPGGDHTIAVGAVRSLGAQPGARPLLFHRGKYSEVGGKVQG